MPPRFERASRALSEARVERVVIGGFKSKRAAGRAKDLQVIPELERILEALERNHKE